MNPIEKQLREMFGDPVMSFEIGNDGSIKALNGGDFKMAADKLSKQIKAARKKYATVEEEAPRNQYKEKRWKKDSTINDNAGVKVKAPMIDVDDTMGCERLLRAIAEIKNEPQQKTHRVKKYVKPRCSMFESHPLNVDKITVTIPPLEDVVEPQQEMVNHPDHYNDYDVECIEMMRRIWGDEAVATWCKLNAFKYRSRMGLKPENDVQQDLEKEQWYIQKYRELTK